MHYPDEQPRPMSFDEYVAWEDLNTTKHEFVHGEVFTMQGGTKRHAKIASNILTRLSEAARGSPCSAYGSDLKVRAAADIAYYPDVAVECGSFDDQALFSDQPCLVVEVTSRSSARIDRGEKLYNYGRVPSIRTYLIVDQNRRRITHHWRDSDGAWNSADLVGSETIALSCPQTTLSLDQIYENALLPPLGVAEPEIDEETGGYVVERHG